MTNPCAGGSHWRLDEANLHNGPPYRLASTDVFDTLLLRNWRSEFSRIREAETLFSKRLQASGRTIRPELLADVRRKVQAMAFRGLDLAGVGEVELTDIIRRQVALLGLPEGMIAERLDIEVDVETRALSANPAVIQALKAQRAAGAKIVAVSDTTLSAAQLDVLIRRFVGPDLIETTYSSADLRKTKRRGDIFAAVAAAEGVQPSDILHMGDDGHADVKVPRSLGLTVQHLTRHPAHRYLRAGNVIASRIADTLARATPPAAPFRGDRLTFGREIFGPIVAQFSMLIWLYAAEAEARDSGVLLFCARGGLGIRQAFEHVLERLKLPLAMPRENLLISRLVAARAALLAGSPAALEEISREFKGDDCAAVGRALSGRSHDLPPEWSTPFDAERFVELLYNGSAPAVLEDIQRQHALFERHFFSLINGARRIILCDTGLYGSTQRLLAGAYPDLQIETIQFARANYKGHGEEHFPKVTGLLTEYDVYHPLAVTSCVMRFWHIIESLFEPQTASVRLFCEDETGAVSANCGDVRFGVFDAAAGNVLLTGALQYIDAIEDGRGDQVWRDADRAWPRLKRAITRPSPDALLALDVGDRSVDFGRSEVTQTVKSSSGGLITRLRSIKAHLWREGWVTRAFPVLKPVLLLGLEIAQSYRGVRSDLRRRRRNRSR